MKDRTQNPANKEKVPVGVIFSNMVKNVAEMIKEPPQLEAVA